MFGCFRFVGDGEPLQVTPMAALESLESERKSRDQLEDAGDMYETYSGRHCFGHLPVGRMP